MAEIFDLIIKGGDVWTRDGLRQVDIAINSGKIVLLDNISSSSGRNIFQANGLTVLPGVIDTQVHFREPGNEHKEDLESGTRSAALGGVTAIFEMPNTNPPTTTTEAIQDKLDRAKGRSWVDYAFFVGADPANIEKLP